MYIYIYIYIYNMYLVGLGEAAAVVGEDAVVEADEYIKQYIISYIDVIIFILML